MFTLPYSIRQEMIIKASPETVWNNIVSFEKTQIWSPWLILDPHAHIHIQGTDGTLESRYSWRSHILGQGHQYHTEITPFQSVAGLIVFESPYCAVYTVCMTLIPQGESTKVTWELQGRLVFFLYFFRGFIVSLIQNDFLRGLVMLKELCETGSLQTASAYEGIHTPDAFAYLGIKQTSTREELPDRIRHCFQEVSEYATKHEIPLSSGICLYTSSNPNKNIYEYISGFLVPKDLFDHIPTQEKLIKGLFPETKTLSVTHHGAYRFLGNSWTLAYAYIRGEKKKICKSIPSYELYLSSPTEVPEEEYVSEVHVPIY